jgi:WhiB family redox-sensing transcriptional regulator
MPRTRDKKAPEQEPRPTFMEHGLCAQIDPEMFYPEAGGSARPAKRICEHCPVTFDCLTWALAHNEKFGIWGGTAPKDRDKMLRQRRKFFRNMPVSV